MKDFQESLEALDLQGLILVIGLLSQRALELMMKEKSEKESKILSPAAMPLIV